MSMKEETEDRVRAMLDGESSVVGFVMYHHVKEKADKRFPGMHFLKVSDFRKQLQAIMRYFDFPSPEDVRKALLCKAPLPHHSCVLTFDDGLRDHYDYVADILAGMNIRAVFSVNTGQWENGKLLPVHMAHLLSAAFSYEQLAADFELSAGKCGVASRLDDVPMDTAVSQYKYDSAEVARVKFFINAVVPQDLRANVIGDVFRSHLGDDTEFVALHYMTPAMVKSLHAAGHTIALHSHWHTHLALESTEMLKQDLGRNMSMLVEAIGIDYVPEWISYPYGSPGSFNDEVIAVCRALGCDVGLTSSRGFNRLPVESNMKLKRVDTNDVECGKKPVPWSELLRG